MHQAFIGRDLRGAQVLRAGTADRDDLCVAGRRGNHPLLRVWLDYEFRYKASSRTDDGFSLSPEDAVPKLRLQLHQTSEGSGFPVRFSCIADIAPASPALPHHYAPWNWPKSL